LSSDYYKISDVAKILGISAELVRHYERLGILKPKRNTNGYRRYTTRDINILTGSRRYVHMGFSIEEAEFMINVASLDEAIDSLEGMEKKAAREIRWKQLILNEIQQLKDKYKLIHDFENNIFKFNLQKSPSVYRINCEKNMIISLKDALSCDIKKWCICQPKIRSKDHLILGHFFDNKCASENCTKAQSF
jgi:DNA-binding transcriptional MerR regulator